MARKGSKKSHQTSGAFGMGEAGAASILQKVRQEAAENARLKREEYYASLRKEREGWEEMLNKSIDTLNTRSITFYHPAYSADGYVGQTDQHNFDEKLCQFRRFLNWCEDILSAHRMAEEDGNDYDFVVMSTTAEQFLGEEFEFLSDSKNPFLHKERIACVEIWLRPSAAAYYAKQRAQEAEAA